MKRVYMDYAATTPLDPRVRRAMEPYFAKEFGNPSSIHAEGVAAKKALDGARATVARALEAHPDEIVFTSGGTEANNLAIFGVVEEWQKSFSGHASERTDIFLLKNSSCSRRRARKALFGVPAQQFLPHIITTTIEHSSVLEPLRALEKRGVIEVSYVPVEKNGIVTPEKIISAIRSNTVLVSVMYANNEIGTIQPIAKIGKMIHALAHSAHPQILPALPSLRGLRRGSKFTGALRVSPLFHVDACQAPLYLHCLVNALGVDLLTLDGHKIYGPKGVGCLYMRRGTPLSPIMFGGGQERGLRATTENVPAIVGFAEAITIAAAERAKESVRILKLCSHLYSLIRENKRIDSVAIINGSMEERKRLPNNMNISLPGIDTEMLTLKLDAAGIACSTKSSCLKDEKISYVVAELGGGAPRAAATLRFTLGRATTRKDIEYTVKVLARLL